MRRHRRTRVTERDRAEMREALDDLIETEPQSSLELFEDNLLVEIDRELIEEHATTDEQAESSDDNP